MNKSWNLNWSWSCQVQKWTDLDCFQSELNLSSSKAELIFMTTKLFWQTLQTRLNWKFLIFLQKLFRYQISWCNVFHISQQQRIKLMERHEKFIASIKQRWFNRARMNCSRAKNTRIYRVGFNNFSHLKLRIGGN